MATLIVCPACGTRYETKAVFPPEGRKVRCSKCAHVWQATPVTAPDPAPAFRPAPAPAQPAMAPKPPSPPPRPGAVNVGMGGFAGISPSPPGPSVPSAAPMPPAPPPFPPAAADADLAAQVARINADAMADAPAAEPPEKRGGIFARLRRSRAPVPPEPGLGDAGMADAKISDAGMGKSDAGMGDASMDEGPQDAGMDERLGGSMGDAGVIFDPALAEQALPQEKRKAPPIVAIGWLLLALFVAGVVGALALAPSAVTSILPGASRLYALFGAPADASGLAFEGVRYGWNDQGGQAVLEVQGDVVNHTSAAVPVPTLVIALADASGEEISEWTTEIGEEELAPGGRAPFLRQIPSPPSNVRSVKVRFAKSN